MENETMIARMGRKKVIEKTVLVRLLPGQRKAIQAALAPGEKLAVFLRTAVTAELERRSKKRRPRS
jgi:hypothetical protein